MESSEALRTRFEALVVGDEAGLPLDEACLLIAAQADPDLDIDRELGRFDELAASVGDPTLDGLVATLFTDLGFSGDRSSYYDPRNSYLHEVMRRRRGIPITLSVVALEVGRRVGVPLEGIGMPGHFLLRDKVDRTVFVDCFAGGAMLDLDGCRVRFNQVLGDGAPFDESYLAPVGRRAIVQRVLANLGSIHRATGDHEGIVRTQALRLAVPGTPDTEWVDYGGALAATGRFAEAARAYSVAAERLDGELAETCRRTASRMLARLN